MIGCKKIEEEPVWAIKVKKTRDEGNNRKKRS
jgi:hypothetical protein